MQDATQIAVDHDHAAHEQVKNSLWLHDKFDLRNLYDEAAREVVEGLFGPDSASTRVCA
jgi:hypothetical protein